MSRYHQLAKDNHENVGAHLCFDTHKRDTTLPQQSLETIVGVKVAGVEIAVSEV